MEGVLVLLKDFDLMQSRFIHMHELIIASLEHATDLQISE